MNCECCGSEAKQWINGLHLCEACYEAHKKALAYYLNGCQDLH